MTDQPRPMQLSEAMLDVLGLPAGNAIPGNVAANAWRIARASYGQPFEGINLGFVGMEASTSFLSGVVSDVDGLELDDDPDDALHELADSAVPIYNAERMQCLRELDPYGQEEVDGEGFGVSSSDTYSEVAGRTLYGMAMEVASALVRELQKAREDEE